MSTTESSAGIAVGPAGTRPPDDLVLRRAAGSVPRRSRRRRPRSALRCLTPVAERPTTVVERCGLTGGGCVGANPARDAPMGRTVPADWETLLE